LTIILKIANVFVSAARSIAKSRIYRIDRLTQIFSEKNKNVSNENSPTEEDESISARCHRLSRSCKYGGSYSEYMEHVSGNKPSTSQKTPVKSHTRSQNESTPVRTLCRRTFEIPFGEKEKKALQQTPSKVLADELINKLSMSSAKNPIRFAIIHSDDLKMKLRKQLFSPKKKGESLESKKVASPPKRARHDKEEMSTENRELLDRMKHLLHTCEIPEKLPCRDTEYKQVYQFVQTCVTKADYSQTLYICGVPGTGKTATVIQAIKNLELNYDFKYAYVNVMELVDSKKIYSKIYAALFPKEKKVSANEARRRLNDFLESTVNATPMIVVIDELDLLCKSRQEFVYDLLNWTEKATFSLGLIAIANTFDLQERFLARRIISRLGTNRLTFEPYKKDDIKAILTYRLQNCDAIQKDAVELTSRKVAAVSGDLRKALDIIRRAIQIAIRENETTIGIETVIF
uniref:Origin recognition complex subunit 1 n=1 Tax=Syphacia muris TaxID=451379 RepID=A0A0N5AVH1_9BILA